MENAVKIIKSLWEHMSENCDRIGFVGIGNDKHGETGLFCRDRDNETHECEYDSCPIVYDWKLYIQGETKWCGHYFETEKDKETKPEKGGQ